MFFAPSLALLLLTAPSLDAKELMRAVYKGDGVGVSGEGLIRMRLTLKDASGRVRVRALTMRGATLDGRSHSIVRFEEPAELRGTAMLSREETSGATTQLMYMPSYGKVRPIAAAKKSERFMGSDFSYADLEPSKLEEGSYKLLAPVACGKAQCHAVEVTPNAARQKSSGYGRIVLHIHPVAKVALRSFFYDPSGAKLIKRMVVGSLKKHGGAWTIFRATLRDERRGSATQMEVIELDRSARFGAADFTEATLSE